MTEHPKQPAEGADEGVPDDGSSEASLVRRRRVFNVIMHNPGLHLREIVRRSGLPMGTVRYVLRYLEDAGLVQSSAEGSYRRYFVRRELGAGEREVLAVIRREVPRGLVLFLLLNPGSTQKDIARAFELAPSTISYHLGRLMQSGLISRTDDAAGARYSVARTDEVVSVLIRYRETFRDHLVDAFIAVFTKRK